ncbi:hypothetical protein AVEN_228890-1 [Araneus ventricosus]|uniref:Uncharacterized protein n=1 Tax=Araneus ventricosus TaxID=182803 RepID=A0A4Y2L8A5_ARAVE|nr:hypothetical protein AVEN_228890-1 [Araneus ventricosus]
MSGGVSEELSRDCAISNEVESMETQTSPAHNFSIEELQIRCSRLAHFNTTRVFLEREIKFSKEELKSIKLSPEANYLNEFISSKESVGWLVVWVLMAQEPFFGHAAPNKR